MGDDKPNPLLLSVVTRERGAALDIQREINKLAKVAHRQYQFAVSDCTFEQAVCNKFRPETLPALYLFKDNEIYLRDNLSKEIKMEDLLEYLSGDVYKQ